MATDQETTEEDGISKALGLVGTLGAVFSYLLVYIFRLGEAMRYRFDPSLITVSINDFLTVLIPIAACLVYLLAVSLITRDLGQSSRRERRRDEKSGAVREEGVGRGALIPVLAYLAPHALAFAIANATLPLLFAPLSAAIGVTQCFLALRRVGRSAHEKRAAAVSHPKLLRINPSRGELLFSTVSLGCLPIWLTLAINELQSSMWVGIVIAALLSVAALATLMRAELHVSPMRWAYEIARRGTKGLSNEPARTAPAIAGVLAVVLGLFLLAGYTNQLDFSGSHSILLSDADSGEKYAVLALFDGNRAVVRGAVPERSEEGDDVSYVIDLSEPYHVVYLTDGYQVLEGATVEVDEASN